MPSTETAWNQVLYGASLDEHRYAETLRACGLLEDLEQLPGGDQTIIGGMQPPHGDCVCLLPVVTLHVPPELSFAFL